MSQSKMKSPAEITYNYFVNHRCVLKFGDRIIVYVNAGEELVNPKNTNEIMFKALETGIFFSADDRWLHLGSPETFIALTEQGYFGEEYKMTPEDLAMSLVMNGVMQSFNKRRGMTNAINMYVEKPSL